MEEQEVCPICIEPVSQEGCHTIPECGHAFHPDCIIGWMRRGNLSCPTCRLPLYVNSVAISEYENEPRIFYFLTDDARQRASRMRRRANSSSAPPDLRRILVRLRQAEREQKDAWQDLRGFTSANADVLKLHRQKEQRTRAARQKVRRGKLRLANYSE